MMRKVNLLAILVAAFLLFACGSSQEEGKQKLKEDIAKMEKDLYDEVSGPLKQDSVKLLAEKYVQFSDNYSKDSLAPSYLLKAARVLVDVGDFQRALKYLNRIEKDYPQHKIIPDALILKGFVYDDHLKNYSKADKVYGRLIEEYPDHHYARDAKVLRENLGKTPEEMIEQFEKQEKAKQDSAEAVAAGKEN
jgi:outer membrane protein assembly factor BamD (BamD/ComL family)